MRRSNSSTHIPVRLFGPSVGSKKDVTKRSNSTGRLSQQKESSAKKFLGNSLERKSKLSFPRTTPLTRKNYATPTSIGSISSIGSRCSRSRVSPATGLKDKKTIQKLSTNSVWVSEQYKKVQRFISESQLFDTSVVNPTNIKPPSIKGFVYLVTTLLSQLYPSVKNITQGNYKEEIVNKLKKLHYPGTMTISTLKSVNTMHSWPQVIGMCGWLVDKIQLTQTGIIDYSTVPPEELHTYLLSELLNNYFCQRYIMYNERSPAELVEQAEEKYKEDFMKILNFDPNEYHQIKTECDRLEEKKYRLKTDNDNLFQEYETLKANRDKLINDLATLEENDAAEQAGLESEVAHFSSVSNKLAPIKKELESKIEVLNERKRNQPCSYQEKEELLFKIESLNNEISLSKGSFDHAQNIKHKFDDMINEERLKLESKVIQWNRSLMEVCIKKQNLKKLLLKETGFYKDQFLEEMREIAKIKQDIEIDLLRKIENIEVTFKQKNNAIQSIKKEMENLKSEINNFILESKQFDKNKAALDEDTRQTLSDWEVQKRNILLSITDSPEVNQVKQLTDENETLRIIGNNKAMEVKQFGESALKFFIELDKQVENNIAELNLIIAERRRRIEELILKRIKDGERFKYFLEEHSRNN